jgi:hypothetical protein
LELYDTKVTNEGIKKLKPALPNCYSLSVVSG